MRLRRLYVLSTMAMSLVAMCLLPGHTSLVELDFHSLVASSDCIVVAKVGGVDKDHGVMLARAVPKRTLKGKSKGELYFVAEPRGTEDTSGAVSGETVILFLEKTTTQHVLTAKRPSTVVELTAKPLYTLAGSGRGRMPIDWGNSSSAVGIHTSEFKFPKSVLKDAYKVKGTSYWIMPLNRLELAIRREVTRQARDYR